MTTAETHLFLKVDLEDPLEFPFCGGRAVVYTHKSPVREGPSEDGAMLLHVEGERGLLVVADGAGGHEGGDRAAAAALLALQSQMSADPERTFRERVLSGFEHADRAVTELRIGAGSTLAAVEVGPEGARSYHVGDSGVLVVGQRGRRKHESISHSPVGYAVEAGVIDEAEALHHEDRHLVSNMLGAEGTHISMSSSIALALRDTVLVASDGLFDNMHVDELIERIRKGPLVKAARGLVQEVRRRMVEPGEARPSKPDDLTFLLYRRQPPP